MAWDVMALYSHSPSEHLEPGLLDELVESDIPGIDHLQPVLQEFVRFLNEKHDTYADELASWR